MIFDPSIDMEEVFDIDNELGEASASTMSEENELFEKEIEARKTKSTLNRGFCLEIDSRHPYG